MLAVQESGTNSYTNLNGENNNRIALRQFNVEVKGLFESDKDAKLWVGKKYVQREDIHINDWYYYDISGTGAGIENVSLGSGKWSFAYVQNADNKHVFDTRYSFPLWDGASFQIGNAYAQMIRQNENDKQANGNMLTLEFTQGFNGGWNKTVFQWKTGNQCGNQNGTAWGANDGNEYDLYNFGETTLGGDLHLFHVVDYAYKKFESDDKSKVWRVVLRPWYKLTKMTRVYAELGAYGEHNEKATGEK